MLYGAAKGTAASIAGLPGDIEQLARQLLLSGAAPDSYTAKNMAAQALLPTSDRVKAMLPSLSSFGAGPQAQYTENVAANLGQNIVGNIVAPKALPAIVRAGQDLPVGASIKAIGEASAPRQTIENIYHGTTPQAAKAIEKSGFDLTKSADGTVWFTSNPNIGEVAASGKGGLVKRSIDTSKMKLGGWDETDKYSTDELINMGFDGLKLTDNGETTYQIFNVGKLSKPLRDAVRQSSGSVYPQAEALRLAQQRAALPVEQGGLGLLESNTAMDRAKAMGFDTPVYHATEADFMSIRPSVKGKIGPGVYTSPDPSYAERYAGGPGAQTMPLLTRGEIAPMDVRSDISDAVQAQLREENPIFDMAKYKTQLNQATANQGYSGYDVDKERLMFSPDDIRSRFAAFDPFRATAATAAAMGVAAPDLLAAPLSVADQIDNINEVLKKKRKK